MGVHNYFMNQEYRIESFFDGRPLKVFELSNKVIMKAYAEKCCDFNFNEGISQVMTSIQKADKNNTSFDVAIEQWGNNVNQRYQTFVDKLEASQ